MCCVVCVIGLLNCLAIKTEKISGAHLLGLGLGDDWVISAPSMSLLDQGDGNNYADDVIRMHCN